MSEDKIPGRFPADPGEVAAAAMDAMLEMVVGCRLTFAERLDAGVLSRATRLLLDLEPVLGCRLDEGWARAEWVRCDGLDEAAAFRLVETEDPDGEAARFHGTPFDRLGPRLAVALLRSASHDDVCLRLDHVAGDGWSAKHAAYLLAETYTRLLADPAYVPVPRPVRRPTHADVWESLTSEQRAAAAKNPGMLATSKWKARVRGGEGGGLACRTLTLPRERVAALRAYAKARGATVNEALLAAIIRATAVLFPQRDGEKAGISVSADTRRFAGRDDLDRIAMIATTQTVLVDYRAGETFEDTLRSVVESVRPYKDSFWNIADHLDTKVVLWQWRAVFRLIALVMRAVKPASLATMNFGPFDEERLRFGALSPVSAIATGPSFRYPGFPATISYYRDALTIWTGFRQRFVAAEYIERFHAEIAQQLGGVATVSGEAAEISV